MALIDKDYMPQSTLDDDVEKALDVNIVDFTDEDFREATIGKKTELSSADKISTMCDELQRYILEKHNICNLAEIGKVCGICHELKKFLLIKNERYGDSALNPIKVFSKGDASDKIDIRMDDKLSRIIESDKQRMNDFVDLTGYLVLKCIDKGWTDFSELLD